MTVKRDIFELLFYMPLLTIHNKPLYCCKLFLTLHLSMHHNLLRRYEP